MKKTLALLLCLAMLFTALTVNVFAETPENQSVEIVTHSASADGTTDFAIKLSGFSSLKGIDMTVTAKGGIELQSASALNTKEPLDRDVNYTITNDKMLHIVELTKDFDATTIITVKAKVTDDATIAVEADLAKSGDALYDEITVKDAKITAYVKPEVVEKVEAETVAQPGNKDYFIPYGSVYTIVGEEYKYAKKDENGTFLDTNGATVKTFKVPEGGFGTFGVSNYVLKDRRDARQFGSVDANYNNTKTYGTLVIIGDWAAFRDYYLANKGYSDADLMKLVYNGYHETMEKGDYDYISFKDGNGNKIKVYDVPQTKVMWQSGSHLEYAVRVSGLVSGSTYTAVGYNVTSEGVSLSSEIKSVAY